MPPHDVKDFPYVLMNLFPAAVVMLCALGIAARTVRLARMLTEDTRAAHTFRPMRTGASINLY
jgi:hypothetical protein